jgi:glutamine amidotransferase
VIAIIDYGLGNVRAFANVYRNLNIPVIIAKKREDLKEATKLLLPGVGAFDYAMQRLIDSGMRETIDQKVLEDKIPVLGICVGMQMLAKRSEEGVLPGLGWIDGEVKKFILPSHESTLRIPHMGWNTIQPLHSNGLLKGMDNESRFYFLHSYYFRCSNPADTIATTHYEGDFESAVNSNNVYGVQFHPEKSHQWGIRLLENFAKL